MNYVGIVLISHSEKIVTGIKEMIRQVVIKVPVEIAGGTDNGDIGTSIDKISTAIDRANQGKGVLLFYDLGSAMMNAELAMELADLQDVELVEAPLVEGAYVAAVEASLGRSRSDIVESLGTSF